jgi:conjugative relaxase-like TrwC/TraI family protein
MLRINQQDSSDGAKKYYASADYYSEGQELIGRWGGEGARLLGCQGVVDKLAFERLCDNLHPQDGKQLTVRTRSDRTVLYDFTWSVPKSVSLLYSMTGDEQILNAFRLAVHETMLDIEAEMKTRVRRGGKDENRDTGNMVWAEFIHKTSRPIDGVPDPQLHIHCAAFNATYDDKERRWKAGQFRDLKRDAPFFQALMRVRLANKLQDLGFGIDRKRDDFEIRGIPASALKKFSRRTDVVEAAYTDFLAEQLAELGFGVMEKGRLKLNGVELSEQQIRAEAQRLGINDPYKKAELGEKTRERKNNDLPWSEVLKAWDSRLTDKERQALIDTYRNPVPYARAIGGEKEAVDYAIAHSFIREAVVPERKLQTEALKRGIGTVTVKGVLRELKQRPLIRGDIAGRAMATSPAMAEMESRLIGFARDGRGKFLPLGDPERACSREWLNDGQKAAVRYVLASRDAVCIIRGVAGTGKTTLEAEIGEALAEAGVPIVAMAPTTGATRVLREEAGFESATTVAGFLKNKKLQEEARGGALLLDEANMLGTRDMLAVFDIAKELGARIVPVGDKLQHRSVAAGAPLKLLEERAGLKPCQVTEIMRQSGDYLKATKALSEGRITDGLKELDRLKWIQEIPNKDRYRLLASAYLAATAEKKKNGEHKSALVISPTHAEGARITDAIRAALKKMLVKEKSSKLKPMLGEDRTVASWVPAHLTDPEKSDATNLVDPGTMLQFHQNAPGIKNGSRLVVSEDMTLPVQYADRFEVYRPGQLMLAAGDRIRITANGRSKDGKHRLNNGDLLTLKGFTKRGDLIVDHDWVIAKEFGHIAHGYCVTSQASEGKTVDKAFAGISSESLPATNRRTLYVAATRGREQCMVVTDDKAALFKAVQRTDEPMSATEFLQHCHRKPTLRQRLTKLLAFRRRTATLAPTHEQRQHQPLRTASEQRENVHVR